MSPVSGKNDFNKEKLIQLPAVPSALLGIDPFVLLKKDPSGAR